MNLSAVASSLSAVRSPDADTRRRGANLIMLGLGMALLALTLSVISTARGNAASNPALLAGVAVLFLGAAALGRAGHVGAGAWLIIAVSVLGTLSYLGEGTTALSAISYLVLAVLLAGVLLPPAQIWLVLGLCLVGVPAALRLGPSATPVSAATIAELASPLLLLVMVATIGFVSATGVVTALRQAQAARREAEAAGEALAATNAALERRCLEATAPPPPRAREQPASPAQPPP
ncbi:MAG TPA: hypothetical protein PKD53_17370, partial [Chloroflexaceae bacterium]|nr:hypothetical protein [Chloroflexaceae bacterium]